MRNFSLMFLLTTSLLVSPVHAAELCFTRIPRELAATDPSSPPILVTSMRRCEDVKAWKHGLRIISIGLVLGSGLASCGASIPVSIGLAAASGATMVAEGFLDDLPCESVRERNDREIHRITCEAAAMQGLTCDPNLLR